MIFIFQVGNQGSTKIVRWNETKKTDTLLLLLTATHAEINRHSVIKKFDCKLLYDGKEYISRLNKTKRTYK